MSVFPTKVLLATDGSEEAELAARTAIEMAEKTGSDCTWCTPSLYRGWWALAPMIPSSISSALTLKQ
jgi:nucleotide-binding universal stress UspA family protein